jgi:hypothetical protein
MQRQIVRTWDLGLVRGALQALAPLAVVGLVVGCSTVDTRYDFDPTANFASFHTYMWKDSAPVKDAAVDQRIVRAVDLALASHNLTKVETGADLFVTYHAAVEQSLDTQSFGYSAGPSYGYGGWYGGGWYGGGYGGAYGSSSSTTRVVKTGTLAIDLVQASSNDLVFRGAASAEIGPPGTNTNLNLNDIVAQIFKVYPPKK